MKINVIVDANACTGCGACVSLCPRQILRIDDTTGTCVVTDQSTCDRLGGCERVCPTHAIRIAR